MFPLIWLAVVKIEHQRLKAELAELMDDYARRCSLREFETVEISQKVYDRRTAISICPKHLLTKCYCCGFGVTRGKHHKPLKIGERAFCDCQTAEAA